MWSVVMLFAACGDAASGVEFSETTDPVSKNTIITGSTRSYNAEKTLLVEQSLSCVLPAKRLSLAVSSFSGTAGADGNFPGAPMTGLEQRWGRATDAAVESAVSGFASAEFQNSVKIDLSGVFAGQVAAQERLRADLAQLGAVQPVLDRLLQNQMNDSAVWNTINALPDRERLAFGNADDALPADMRTPALDSLLARRNSIASEYDSLRAESRSFALLESMGDIRNMFDARSTVDYYKGRLDAVGQELKQHRETWGELSADMDPNSLVQTLGPDWAFNITAHGGKHSVTMDVSSMKKVVSACTR